MSDATAWPTSVPYSERLTPDAPPVLVELPSSIDDELDLLSTVNRLAREDYASWKATVRMHSATDWFFMALLLSGTQRLNPFTGKPEILCPFQFNYSREMQFDGNGVLDKSARGHWKSTWRNYIGLTVCAVNDPNMTAVIAAHTKDAAQKHGVKTMLEWQNNTELRAAWDDVFWDDPINEAPVWNQESGCTLRRTLPSTLPSLSWHSILLIPTGSRIGIFSLDDVENEKTVESPEMREKTLGRVASFLDTAGRLPTIWINATAHHAQGVVSHMESSGAFRVRCHPAEDESLPAPDVAALYDECGGEVPNPLGGVMKLPPAVRDIRLDGAPTYMHALELAHKRLLAMSVPGGLINYYRQYMGQTRAGEQRRLDVDWIRRYSADPAERARGGYGYVLIDPSKGRNDPTFVRLEVTRADKSISWCGAIRRKLSPSEFAPAIYAFCSEWEHICQLRQIRVEEFGQSTWSFLLRDYFQRRGEHFCPIIACARHTQDNRESHGRQREWLGLEPLYRQGRRWFPKGGIVVETDRDGQTLDVVDYYITKEYEPFPTPDTDDGLAADYLLAVTTGRNEAGKNVDLFLEYPESDEEAELSERSMRGWGRRSGALASEDEASWMSGEWAYN